MNTPQSPVQPPEPTAPAPVAQKPRQWAVIELYGRTRITGEVSEQRFSGMTFTRVEVPEVTWRNPDDPDDQVHCIPAHATTLSAGAIFSINWLDEASAVCLAHVIRHAPAPLQALNAGRVAMLPPQREALFGGATP